MGFLRRLLGGGSGGPGDEAADAGRPEGAAAGGGETAGPETPEADEAERERELLGADSARLADELLQRQLRYADRKWTPPAQGGPARAEDGDPPAG